MIHIPQTTVQKCTKLMYLSLQFRDIKTCSKHPWIYSKLWLIFYFSDVIVWCTIWMDRKYCWGYPSNTIFHEGEFNKVFFELVASTALIRRNLAFQQFIDNFHNL